LALFPPTRELYRISIHSHFVKFLADASGFGIGIICLSQNFVCLRISALFWSSFHQQGTCIEFRSIRAWSDFLQMLLDLIFCIICLAFLSVFESRLFFALFPATRDLHCILIHFHLARFLTDVCGFEIASSVYQEVCLSLNLGWGFDSASVGDSRAFSVSDYSRTPLLFCRHSSFWFDFLASERGK
jgi:hypothetical protein